MSTATEHRTYDGTYHLTVFVPAKKLPTPSVEKPLTQLGYEHVLQAVKTVAKPEHDVHMSVADGYHREMNSGERIRGIGVSLRYYAQFDDNATTLAVRIGILADAAALILHRQAVVEHGHMWDEREKLLDLNAY